MAGEMGMEDPFYNDRLMVHHDYYEYAIIFFYTKSIVYQNMERGITMCIYSISWSLKTSGQFEMAGQMGMEDPFYSDRPKVLQIITNMPSFPCIQQVLCIKVWYDV